MRLNGQIAATLLVVGLAAVGCSNGEESSQPNTQAPRVTPVSLNRESSDLTPSAIKGFDGPSKIAGPASFADGEAAYQAGKYGEATTIFERYTAEKPDNAWGHYMLGLSASKNGDPAKAETAFDKALSIDPDHVKSLVNLSRVLIDQKRLDEALDKLAHASDLDPNSAEVHRLMGRAYAAQGKTDDAVVAYRAAIALDDKDAWSMNNLGFLFLEQGRAVDAISVLARAVELRKDVAIFHNNLGMALEHTGHFTAAATEYNGALAADPGYEKAQRNLARVEAVKVKDEEPFDLEAAAKGAVDEKPVSVDATVANQ